MAKLAIFHLVLLFILSGCIEPGFSECRLPREEHDSSASVTNEISAAWNHTYTQGDWSEGKVVRFGVDALRTSPPDPPAGDHEVSNDTQRYVDWNDVVNSDHLEILHDLLCVSDWKARTLISPGSPFSTYTAVGDQVFEDAIEALREEFLRQNGVPATGNWCCYILYEDEFYATGTRVPSGH